MYFETVKEWVALCEEREQPLWVLALESELALGELSKADIYSMMEERLTVMEESAAKGLAGVISHSGLSGGDAKKMQAYRVSGKGLMCGFVQAAMANAIAINECNAAMGVICATPTAGSAGTCAAVLLAARHRLDLTRKEQLHFLLTAGRLGMIIGNLASISGAAGGCQAEVGSASAMAATALVEAAGGTPAQAAHACAMALKNVLGLVCDPVAGLVEIPCIKRNVMGAVNAISAAEMALAGITSKIPADEVIRTMGHVGTMLPQALRETALGGLATTPTGRAMEKQIKQTDY